VIVAGSIIAVSINGREFPVDAACEASLNTGGYVNSVSVAGSGASRISQAPIPWAMRGLDLAIDDDRGDLGFLAEVFNAVVSGIGAPGLSIPAPPKGPDRVYLAETAKQGVFVPVSVTVADGSTWSGSGTIEGEIVGSTKTGCARIDLVGDGEMTREAA
jgi:hypothetical protein